MRWTNVFLGVALLFALNLPAVARDPSGPPHDTQELIAADAPSLPVRISPDDPNLAYVGRFDWTKREGSRCAWSASTIVIRFRGTDLNLEKRDSPSNRWQIEIDGKPAATLKIRAGKHLYRIAAGLLEGEHIVRVIKATEAACGATQILGFQINEGGALLPAPLSQRRIEVIGDSISAGFGNEAANEREHYSPETQNAYFTYGAIAARQLGADYMCVAWSGKTMWPQNTIPELYERILPAHVESKWDFTKWQPDVVLINLGTNDFSAVNPDEAGWTGAYKSFIKRLRGYYPSAQIYCASGPMLNDLNEHQPLTTLRRYLNKIVAEIQAAGDARVGLLDFGVQDPRDGLGADFHPNIKTHNEMAERLVQRLRQDLEW
jgi:Carbohydrate esterase 2 N-terminal/GDSL-like Lipase/Acylhydrolase family